MKFVFYLFVFVVIVITGFSQTKFDNKSRAKFIFDIAKQVTWPNEATIDTFKLCVLTNDVELFEQLSKLAKIQLTLHKKPVKVLSTNEITNIPECQLLFFKHDENYDIYKVSKNLKLNNTLLVTENFDFHKSMINFLVVDNRKRYEVNLKKLHENGFKVTELFAEGAVKSQTDWEQLYKLTDIALQKQKEIVEQQNQQILQQRQEIIRQQSQILSQKEEIQKQAELLKRQRQGLDSIKKQVKITAELLRIKILELEQREKVLKAKNEEINQKSIILASQKIEIEKQNNRINVQKKVLNEQLEKIHMQQLILYLFVGMVLMLIVLAFFIYRNYKIKKQANQKLKLKNEEILKQNEEIRRQKEEIVKQRDEIALQKQEIMDSIRYASRIQQALLPPIKTIENLFCENFFIFNRPRDIVSGDYYFITSKAKKLIVSVADCTGHGVPGAFMSLLGISFLNEIISKLENLDAAIVLDKLRENIIGALNQGVDNQTKDGMDMVLCIFDFDNNFLEFAGANNAIYHISNGELMEYKGDKMPIGVYEELKPFTKKVIPIKKNDTFYLFSDGYADQFGGPNGKKFKYQRIKQMLLSIQHLPMKEQYKIVEETIDKWKNGYFQVDDILLMGIKY